MNQVYQNFLTDSASVAFDLHHREVLSLNVMHYEESFSYAKGQFSNLQLARKRAGLLKHSVIEHLEDHLKTFEQNFTNNGGQVIWAESAADARKAILDIFEQNKVKTVVTSRSKLTEEMALTTALEKNGIESIDTALGDYMAQLTNDQPYHMVNPIMQLSAKEIVQVLHEKFGLPLDSTPADIADFVRQTLRKKFLQADAGITGANFLLADTGSVVLNENEGNGILSMAMPRIHIVVTGIENLLASVNDLNLFLPLLATHATGQKISVYNTLVNGPRSQDERDGPEQMFVVLVDNGRSRLLGATPQRRSLSCIRCGACLNACPVFRNIGGHAYGSVYSGPIGAIITPFLTGKFEEYQHLSFASSLCGKCTEVCPVGIDLHHQLMYNRRLSVKKGYTTRAERWAMWAFKVAMKKRSRLDFLSPKRKNILFRRFLSKAWGDRRDIPLVVKSFASMGIKKKIK